MSDADSLKEDFIDLQENQGCETKFPAASLSHFWCDWLVAYPGLAKAELQMTTPFPTTYQCKKAFSTMLLIKTTLWNRLHGGLLHSMSMALANAMLRYEKLVAHKQEQKSLWWVYFKLSLQMSFPLFSDCFRQCYCHNCCFCFEEWTKHTIKLYCICLYFIFASNQVLADGGGGAGLLRFDQKGCWGRKKVKKRRPNLWCLGAFEEVEN